MKSLCTGLALLILFNMFSIYQNDSDIYSWEIKKLRIVAEDAANAAGVFKDSVNYSNGKLVFNQTNGNAAVKYFIMKNLNLDTSMVPVSGYWRDKIKYWVYYFDTSNTIFPYNFTDAVSGFNTVIVKPTIVVTIDAGRPLLRLTIFNGITSTVRSAAWEYDER